MRNGKNSIEESEENKHSHSGDAYVSGVVNDGWVVFHESSNDMNMA